jgi:hypothetical protein
MDRIFIDSGAFIALLSEKDAHHREALATYLSLMADRVGLLTTNHVVDEACTRLLRTGPGGHRLALGFGEMIGNSKVHTDKGLPYRTGTGLLVLYSTPEIERRAWEIFGKYDTARFSYTDCVSFAVMQMLSLSQAFAFDSHFDMMGFQRLPAP